MRADRRGAVLTRGPVMDGRYRIAIAGEGESYRCDPGDNLYICFEKRGLARLPKGCRNGGCGRCRIAVVSGRYTTKVMSREHVSLEDQQNGIVLACRVWPAGDLTVRLIFEAGCAAPVAQQPRVHGSGRERTSNEHPDKEHAIPTGEDP